MEEGGEEKKKAEEDKGVKRKFGESGLNLEELKPWNIRYVFGKLLILLRSSFV